MTRQRVPVDGNTRDWPRKVANAITELQNDSTIGGAVTSVAATVPTGFQVSGSPITSSGTLAFTFASGYSLPTTAKQTDWDTAFGWGDHAGAGYLANIVEDTTPQLGGTLDANSNDIDMGANLITDTKVGQWDTAYSWGDHSAAGYLTTAAAASTYQPLDTQLTDLAGLSYSGNSLKVVRVNSGETGFELATVSGGGVSDGDKGDITVSSSGTVWSIDAGVVDTTELADDAVTAAKLADTAVTPGSYTNADITVDQQGRITAAASGSSGSGQTTLVTTLDYGTTASASNDIDVTGYDEVWIQLVGVTIGAGEYAFRLSDDGGSTFYAGASDYIRSGFQQASISETNTAASFARIGFGAGTSVNGFVYIKNLNKSGINPTWNLTTTELVGVLGTGIGHCIKTSGPFDYLRILNVSGNNSTAGKVFVTAR